VNITEFRSQPVSVLGAVKTPGVYPLRGPKTLMEVLSAAGGLEPDAGNTLKITRQAANGAIPLAGARMDASGRFSIAEVSLRGLMDANDPRNNIPIYPNDVLTVPRGRLVYVMGEVQKPGGYVLRDDENASILQVLAMSSGLLRTASAKNARILRAVPNQPQRVELPVNVSRILQGKAEDLKLKPDDILFVPTSAPKNAALRGVEAAIQIGTGVVIWRR
jgi:polysaccharide export outer membrane protein